jgi:hypothetical protein
MFPLLLSIFVTYPKEKMKENDFFFFFVEKFGYAWGMRVEVPRSTSTQKVSGMSTALFLEYPCFIACVRPKHSIKLPIVIEVVKPQA